MHRRRRDLRGSLVWGRSRFLARMIPGGERGHRSCRSLAERDSRPPEASTRPSAAEHRDRRTPVSACGDASGSSRGDADAKRGHRTDGKAHDAARHSGSGGSDRLRELATVWQARGVERRRPRRPRSSRGPRLFARAGSSRRHERGGRRRADRALRYPLLRVTGVFPSRRLRPWCALRTAPLKSATSRSLCALRSKGIRVPSRSDASKDRVMLATTLPSLLRSGPLRTPPGAS